jgi:competence protein ComEC
MIEMAIIYRCLIIFCLLIGIVSCSSYDNIETFKYNQNILLSGVVTTIPKLSEDKLEVSFHSYKYGDILLKIDKDYQHFIIPANKLQLEAKLYKPYEYDNIAAFNYSDYLDHKHIVALGSIVKNSKIKYNGIAFSYLPERIRYYLYQHLEDNLKSYQLKSFVLALLIGDKDFNNVQQNLLISSGTSHLMVISGLHIGLLALLAYILFRGLWSLSPRLSDKLPAQYIGVIFSVFIAFVYSLLAGFSLPTQRALIMLSVVALLWLLKKKISLIRCLIIAFTIILILDFRAIYSVSLWLSFLAVAALIVIGVLLQQYKSKLASTLLAQFYLAIFLIPISTYFFGSFSLVSILANIVAIPLVSFIIVPLLLFCLLISFIGIKLWVLPIFFLNLLYSYLEFLTDHIGLINYWSNFSILSLLIVIIGIFLVIFPFAKPIRILGLVMCLVFFQSTENQAQKYNYFQLHIFDTKKIMALVQNLDKSLLYIDADNLQNKYIISNILKNYMKANGLKEINYLIIVGNQKSINLKHINSILQVKKIVSNIDSASKLIKCDYSNNFLLTTKLSVKFLAVESSCLINLGYKNHQFLLMNKDSLLQQQKIYNLYSRVINPDIIISATLLDPLFLKLEPQYLIYSSTIPFKKLSLGNYNIRVFDTYANGAITITLNSEDKLNIVSQLKKY